MSIAVSAYRPPALRIFQDFARALAAGTAPNYAVIVGPNYNLHRYEESDEKASLGTYDASVAATTYLWPDHVAGAEVDYSNAVVWAEDALIRYYQSYASCNVTADNGNSVLSGVVFKTNSYADRTAAAFGTRDVQVNDTAIFRWTDAGVPQTFETVVSGFTADTVAGTTNPTPAWATGNFGDTTLGATEPSGHVDGLTPSYSAVAYDGLPYGYPEDTYTIRVNVAGTTGTGLMNGTVLAITSAGGDNPTTNITLSDTNWDGAKYDVALGDRGARLYLVSVPAETLAAGSSWTVVISQDYTEVDVSLATEFDATGPYTGTKNTQYQVRVLTGGVIGTDDVLFSFSTSNGADISSQIAAYATDFTGIITDVDYTMGNKGMVLTIFDGTEWNTGDMILIDVEAPSSGAIHTLVLRDPLPVETTDDLDLDLHLTDTVEFPDTYITADGDDITIDPAAQITGTYLGVSESFYLLSAALYADYRELLDSACSSLATIDADSTQLQLEEVLGPAVEDNPLSLGVWMALQNSGDVDVYYLPICTDNETGYTNALDVLSLNKDIWGIVPLTDDADVIDAYAQHVVERSSSEHNQWRTLWTFNPRTAIRSVITALPAGTDMMATVASFGGANLYRKVICSGALFITREVAEGDTIRINFSTDADGNETYDEYLVDRIIDENTLLIATSLSGAITVPVKIEVWRTLSKADYAAWLRTYPTTTFGSLTDPRRIRVQYMDGFEDASGNSLDLYYLSAACAGLRSGASPHAPLSREDMNGVYSTPVQQFGDSHLNTIASGGNWIVVEDIDGSVYARHELTADMETLERRQDSVTSNIDNISRACYAAVEDLYGRGNVSPDMLNLIRQRLNAVISSISNRPYPDRLGPQMLDAEITLLEIDSTYRDTINVEIDPDAATPFNEGNITFRVGSTD